MRLTVVALIILAALAFLANSCSPACYQGVFESDFENRGTWTFELQKDGTVSGTGTVEDVWPQPISVTLSGQRIESGVEVEITAPTGETGNMSFGPPKDTGWTGDWTFKLQDGTLIGGAARGHRCED